MSNKKVFTDESLATLVDETKSYVDDAVSKKADVSHSHNDIYYTESEIDNKIFEINTSINGKSDVEHTHSWDDLIDIEDKLFDDVTVTDTLVWDGNTDGLQVFDMMKDGTYMYYHVSGNIISLEDLANGVIVETSDTTSSQSVECKLTDFRRLTSKVLGSASVATLLFALEDNAVIYNNTIPKKGIYFMRSETNGYVSRITIPEYNGFSSEVHVLKNKYMPNDYATKEELYAKVDETKTDLELKLDTHNTSTSAHNDIRNLINGLTIRLNTLADSDDATLDQMSEVVAYIKANKGLIDSITTTKVNVSDIVDNLTTNVTNKPLSAAQGVAIKSLIDALQSELDSHGHDISDVSGLQSALNGKANSSHGTHVAYSTTNPVMDGTASVGSASTVARSDHKHPTDTSRASKTEFDSHNIDTTKHITSTERTNWNAAKTHADSAHAPSNAQANQNAFSNVKVGTTTIAADTTTDTLELVGSNVTITPDATNDKVTIAVADGTTSAKGVVKLENSTSSTSTTTAATPNSVKSAYDLANTAKTNAATAQSKADSAYDLANGKADANHVHNNSILNPIAIEMNSGGGLDNFGGFIDFHFDGSSDDYTSRIIEDSSGTLNINKVKLNNGTVTGTLNGNATSATKATQDGNGKVIASTYLPLAGGTLTGNITIAPAGSGNEGGEIGLKAPSGSTAMAGTTLDNYNSTFRIFGIPSADGKTKAGVGTPLTIDPYAKTITGGYTMTGNLSGTATKATQDGSGNTITSTYATKTELNGINWYASGTSIPQNADLNTYTTDGKYYASNGTTAQSLSNCPVTDNFSLYVFRRTSSSITNQLLITDDAMYIRGTNSSGTFTNWTDVASKRNDLGTQVSIISQTTYTVPSDGYIMAKIRYNDGSYLRYVLCGGDSAVGMEICLTSGSSSNLQMNPSSAIYVRKGMIVKSITSVSKGSTANELYFLPLV